MSYTKFSFSDLVVSDVGDDASFNVSVTVKNDGPLMGSEVVQLYISYPDVGVTTPVHQLKGFAKARDVAPGASSTVVITLDKYAVSFWDTMKHAWSASAGKYILNVGASSTDFRLKGEVELKQGFTWTGM